MGQSQLLALGAALILGAALPAQGPLYRERWADLHLELLRECVLRESQGRDAAMLAKVAELLSAPDQGVPFRPAAQALALLRGVECDDAFLLRAMISAFVLPEVLDPTLPAEDAAQDCRSLNLSLSLPYSMPLPGKVTFDVDVMAETGERVFAGKVESDTSLDDLRMARAVFHAPGESLPDGTYQVRVATCIDGNPPRPQDYRLAHRFFVLRGYKARADAARTKAQQYAGKIGETADAVLQGFLLEVNRAYAGAAFDGSSDAVADLLRLEHGLANQADDKAPWIGLHGDIPLSLPTEGTTPMGAVVRFPEGKELRPLVVFMGASPAYDLTGRRPAEPAYRTARWVARRLGDFGLGAQCNVAWLQSPASTIQFPTALPKALLALRQMLPTDGRVVLVLEYEAASLASFAAEMLSQNAVAVVLVGAGAFTAKSLQQLGPMRVLGVPMSTPGNEQVVQRNVDLAGGKLGKVEWEGRYEAAAMAPRPWPFGAMAARAEIVRFVRDVLQLPAK